MDKLFSAFKLAVMAGVVAFMVFALAAMKLSGSQECCDKEQN